MKKHTQTQHIPSETDGSCFQKINNELTKQSLSDVTIVIGLYVPSGHGCGRSSDSGQLCDEH